MPADKHVNSIAAQFAATDTEFERIERVARIGHWWWFPSDNSSWWSPGLYVILDANPANQPPDGHFFETRVVPEDRERVHNVFRSARKNRAPHSCRFRLARDPDRIIAVRGDVELGPDGEPHAYFAVFQDVTDVIRAERERDRALDLYRLVAEHASDVITLRAPGGAFQIVSPALREVMGIEPDEFSLERLLAICHPDDREEVANYVPYEPKPGEVARITSRIYKDGKLVWIETTKRSFFDDEGNLKGIVAVTRDMTEAKKIEIELRSAQERAEAANRAKSRFLANMSHELRTPLNAIIGFADIMRQQMFGYLGSERYSEYAMLIYDSGQLLLDLISDVLDMAKIDAGKLELNYESIDAGVMLDTCIRFLGERAEKAGIDLRVSLPARRIAFDADRRSVKQILLNLLSNAIKFTLPGGNVEASASQEGDVVVFVIRDNGIGIPATELPRLGRPFEQVAADPLLAQSGTGLGLALVRSLSERHGGSFKLESEEGKGTCVEIRIPLSRPKPAVAAA